MEVYEEISLDCLSEQGVSILKRKYIYSDGQKNQVGDLWRRAYVNSESGGEMLKEDISESYLPAILNIWGDSPTVEDTTFEETEETEG